MLSSMNLKEIVMCLEDLINYFAQPDAEMGQLPVKCQAALCDSQFVHILLAILYVCMYDICLSVKTKTRKK